LTRKYRIAVLGAAGAVGTEMIKVLAERDFPVKSLTLLATERSAGKSVRFNAERVTIKKASRKSFQNIDIALFSAGSKASKIYAPIAIRDGAVVIDNSSAFRMDAHVPLVVPEVNPDELAKHKGIIANPNCSTIQLVVALKPIYDLCGISRIIVSTYQAVSGTGTDAIRELRAQSRAVVNHKKLKRRVYPHQIAFNILPQIAQFEETGYSTEEMKLVHETSKILNDQHLAITATTARVPVFIGHCESVYIETRRKISINRLRTILHNSPGIKLVDDIRNNKYPLPIMSEMYDEVMVGRIRRDLAAEKGINMWIVANNLRKGAALNAVQIAEKLIAYKGNLPR